jgi:hypothetical protein
MKYRLFSLNCTIEGDSMPIFVATSGKNHKVDVSVVRRLL